MKRVIKVGDRYLGLVDSQSDALKFDDSPDAFTALHGAAKALHGHHLVTVNNLDDDRFRTVKLTSSADRSPVEQRIEDSAPLSAEQRADLMRESNADRMHLGDTTDYEPLAD